MEVRTGINNGLVSWNSTDAPLIFVNSSGTTDIYVSMNNYGSTGWDGYSYVNYSNLIAYSGTIYLNTYSLSGRYSNSYIWKAIACHEMGHILGLGHNDLDSYTIMKTYTLNYYNYLDMSTGYHISSPQSADITTINGIY